MKYRYVKFSETDGYWEPVANPMKEWTDPAQLHDSKWPSLEWFDFSTLGKQADGRGIDFFRIGDAFGTQRSLPEPTAVATTPK